MKKCKQCIRKKVYCRNCKFNRGGFGVEFDFCEPYLKKPKKKVEHIDDFREKYHKIKTTIPQLEAFWMEELNSDNNCIYYKRKWWKLCSREDY